MMMRENVPVYVVTGFLESGKTSFLRYSMDQEGFMIERKTLLLLCEQGEEEYDPRDFERLNTVMEVLEDESQFTPQTLQALDRKHRPARVMIEYNPLWGVGKLYDIKMPRSWQFVQHIVTIDATTFKTYLNNMRSIFQDMINGADLVAFNRCNTDMPLAEFRRSVKAVNQQCTIIFEDMKGEILDTVEDIMPFDVSGPVIHVDDMDYGIWYLDVRDHPDRYEGKSVAFRAQVVKSREKGAQFFVPGRRIMTCCAEDIRFMGYLCKSDKAPQMWEGTWINLQAKVRTEYNDIYREEGPVLYAEKITPAEKPEDELVYFN